MKKHSSKAVSGPNARTRSLTGLRLMSAAAITLAGLNLAAADEPDEVAQPYELLPVNGHTTGAAAGTSERTPARPNPRLCAAVRGNGLHIITHFVSLARVVETYGRVDGMAGGSSGSISTFIYESILKNPVVHTCGAAPCSPEVEAARIALMLKSLQGYGKAVGDSDEGVAVGNLMGLAGKLSEAVKAKGIWALFSTDTAKAARLMIRVLQIPELFRMVNPDVFRSLLDVPNLMFNMKEIKTTMSGLGGFKVDDNRLFFRGSLINWPMMASFFGRVGDFYAGYGPSNPSGMAAWLDACAVATKGKPWVEVAEVAMAGGAGGKCGTAFAALVDEFRAQVRGGNAVFESRIDDDVGDPASPLRKLVSTAVLEGEAATLWKTVQANYARGRYPEGDVPFAPSFNDVKFGYWGAEADLETVASNPRRYNDAKTRKFSSLGNRPWREVLAASPAEPGLSPFVELSDGRVSAGGWSDLAPVLALKNLGCQFVIYISREGDESTFATGVAKKAGMTSADWDALYDLSKESSGYSRSIAAADGVWCTKWNDFKDTQTAEMAADSWNSPLEARTTFAAVTPLFALPAGRVSARTGRIGCTPGMSGGAVYPP